MNRNIQMLHNFPHFEDEEDQQFRNNKYYPDSSLNSEMERLFGTPRRSTSTLGPYYPDSTGESSFLDDSSPEMVSKNRQVAARPPQPLPNYNQLCGNIPTSPQWFQRGESNWNCISTPIGYGHNYNPPQLSYGEVHPQRVTSSSCSTPIQISQQRFEYHQKPSVQRKLFLEQPTVEINRPKTVQNTNYLPKVAVKNTDLFQSTQKLHLTDFKMCKAGKQNSEHYGMPTSETPNFVSCKFCRKNGEGRLVYNGHQLKNERGIVTCPILRKYVCSICKATGDNAHTRKYCPFLPNTPTVKLPVYRRLSNGHITTCHNHK